MRLLLRLGLQARLLGDDVAVDLALAYEPGRRVGDERADLLGGECVGDPSADEPGAGDAELRSGDVLGERAVAAELREPGRRVGAQGVELGARDR